MFLLVTFIACLMGWVSWKVHRARAQRLAVQKLRESGNLKLGYDWQLQTNSNSPPQPPGPQWLRDKIGDEYFQEVISVFFLPESEVDLTPLAEFSKLETLQVENSALTIDLYARSPGSRRLQDGIQIPPGLEPLANLRSLKHLSIEYLGSRDLTPLANLRSLEQLSIISDSVEDIFPLAGLSELTLLRLNLPTIDDLSALEGMRSLKSLSLRGASSSPVDLSSIGKLSNLQELRIHAMQMDMKSLRPLAQLSKLEHLDVHVHADTDLKPLSELNSLQTFNLYTTQTRNDDERIKFLAGLSQLKNLQLTNLQLNDLSILIQLEHLEELNLNGIQAKEWSALTKLPHLEEVAFLHCNITDITPLAAVKSLRRLLLHSMDGDEWNDEQVQALRDALPDCAIAR